MTMDAPQGSDAPAAVTDRRAMLAYAGALPFVIGAGLLILGRPVLPEFGPVILALAAWGLTIVSFMAGVHWGQYLASGERIRVNLLFTSNATAIVAWLAFLLLPLPRTLLVFAALFGALLLIDRMLKRTGQISESYWRTRRNVTGVVILSLLVAVVFV